MAATQKKGPTPLTEAQFTRELAKRMTGNPEPEPADVKLAAAFIKAFKAETIDCLINGYKVTLTGLCNFVPKVVPGAKAGSKSRNPSTGVETIIKADQPDTLGYRIGRSSAVNKMFPSLRSNVGKALFEKLYVPPKKPAKTKA